MVTINMTEIRLSLVNEINKSYQLAQENYIKAQEYGNKALYHAKNCGEKLIEAKNNCEHGEWLQWLSENTSVPSRTAQRFMKIADNWDVIEAEISNNEIINFGINDAQKLLSGKNTIVCDSPNKYGLSEDELKSLKLHEDSIKSAMSRLSLEEKQMKESFLELKKDFNNDVLFDSWVKLETNWKPEMIREFITTDKSLFMDLLFEYYNDQEIVEWITKNQDKS